jgi:hypothetical protein
VMFVVIAISAMRTWHGPSREGDPLQRENQDSPAGPRITRITRCFPSFVLVRHPPRFCTGLAGHGICRFRGKRTFQTCRSKPLW